MDLNSYFLAAPKLRPQLNMGCLFDIPNGRYLLGANGESILNGGLAYITGVGGRGNTFKSVITHFLNLRVLSRYIRAQFELYDTETSATLARLEQLSQNLERLQGLDFEESPRIHLTDNTVMSGNEWFAKLKELGEFRQKNAKDFMMTLPFIDEKTGKYLTSMSPMMAEMDSLSMFMTDSVENIYDKNQIGDGGANTDSLRGAAAKSQMLMQLPTLTGKSAMYITMTMHVGDQHQLDQYNPKKPALSFLKGGVAFKHVPQKITFLTNSLWYVLSISVFQNKATKAPEYPASTSDNMEGDTDLQLIQLINLRAKNGPTGMPFEIVLSQSEGVLVGLTELNYIKHFDRFGLGGNDRNYFLDLLPEVGISRTTVRAKLNESAPLRRAMEITSEMCQMKNLWDDEEKLFCTPKQLYDDLKAKGYDWNVLLNTRGYWVFEEDKADDLPFLSTRDLLRMRAGLYHPYWLPKL